VADEDLVFRPMSEEDLPAVLAIERDLFPDPWPRWMFLEDIRGGEHGADRALAIVGEEAGEIACYGIVWRVGPEFHIANMAVRRRRQGAGVGKRLLDYVLEEGERWRCAVATLEVRPSNDRALRLYRSRAFREVAVRRGYYRNGEDALVMLRELAGATEKNGGLVQEE
jgi:ribosomal-protein-alanine N-acetyltransferase